VASPIGLRLALEENDNTDILSSIDIVILDHLEYYVMQNWDHVEYILEKINLMPKEYHDSDVSRIRNYYLDDKSKYFRQTIVFSEIMNIDINRLFNRFCFNYEGIVKIGIDMGIGTIASVVPKNSSNFSKN